MACNYCTNGCNRCNNKGYQYGDIGSIFRDLDIKNSLPDEVSDPKELKKFFRDNKYIPYFGYYTDSAHLILKYIKNIARLSPTQGGIINCINFNAFGGPIQIVRRGNKYFEMSKLDDRPIGSDLEEAFIEHLMEIDLGDDTWESLPTELGGAYKTSGTTYLRCQVIKTGSTFTRKMTFIEDEHIFLQVPNLFNERLADYSLRWDRQYLKENPPVTIPLYPKYNLTPDGSCDTLIQIRNKGKFYGRPDWWNCAQDAYLEIKNKEYLVKSSSRNFTPQVFFEFTKNSVTPAVLNDKAAQKLGHKNTIHRWYYNYTMDSNEFGSIFVTEKDQAAANTMIHEFNLNMKEKYFKEIDNMTGDNIVIVNNISWQMLFGGQDGNGWSSANHVESLKVHMPMFNTYQNRIDNGLINTGIEWMDERIGETRFKGLGIKHKSPYQKIMDDMEITIKQKNTLKNQDSVVEGKANDAENK